MTTTVRWVTARELRGAVSSREERFETKRDALRAIDRRRAEVCSRKPGTKPSKALTIERVPGPNRTYVVVASV